MKYVIMNMPVQSRVTGVMFFRKKERYVSQEDAHKKWKDIFVYR